MTQTEAPRFRKLPLAQISPAGYELSLKLDGHFTHTYVFLTSNQGAMLHALLLAIETFDKENVPVTLTPVWNVDEETKSRGLISPRNILTGEGLERLGL